MKITPTLTAQWSNMSNFEREAILMQALAVGIILALGITFIALGQNSHASSEMRAYGIKVIYSSAGMAALFVLMDLFLLDKCCSKKKPEEIENSRTR